MSTSNTATASGTGTIIVTVPNATAVATINEIVKKPFNWLLFKLFPPQAKTLDIAWSEKVENTREFILISGIFTLTVALCMSGSFNDI